ncbi:TPA: ead/Ea22-like family protein [Escherichia coli]|nr:ead/Ea22-like family protein [Escherichia coli]HDI6284191.1 ead/Ea22-like family protein [Escherichia coli]
MTKINYQALREAAEKATCGEWSLEYGESRFDGDDALIHREVAGYIPICRIEGAHPESGFDEDFQMEQQANAEFIAAANPATVLALLDERERNQQYIKRRDQENEDIALTVGRLRVELEAAKKRIAELEAEPVSQTYKFPVNTPCQDAPAHIWLQTAGVWPEDGELSELTWCSHNQHHDDTLYVRADLVNGNSPVTPDGWISCSEQMPVIGELNWRTGFPLLITCEIGVIPAYYGFVSVNGDKHYGFMESFKYGDDRGGHPKTNEYGLISNVTHWMPLPEPPQEVK